MIGEQVALRRVGVWQGIKTLAICAAALVVWNSGSLAQSESQGGRVAISVGGAAVFPMADLARQDQDKHPDTDVWYATAGSGLVQRLSYAVFPALGVFAEASFPGFGMDVAAVQADFNSNPPLVEGKSDISAWSAGLRWRAGRSWLNGLYAEASLGTYRQRVETRLQGAQPDSAIFEWKTGWGVAAGWVVPLGTALALDLGVTLHEFHEENVVDGFVNRWVNRWLGLRVLAVLTFGGGG
jgi:hypothetical protein